nr:MAG TPA: hypothetical protein [Caudoviricetes sp.]
MDGKFCIVRARDAGVFFGKVICREHDEVLMCDVRRIWSWEGACSCTQLALDGTKKPDGCRITRAVDDMVILGVIEIIPCTDRAIKSLKAVPVWEV